MSVLHESPRGGELEILQQIIYPEKSLQSTNWAWKGTFICVTLQVIKLQCITHSCGFHTGMTQTFLHSGTFQGNVTSLKPPPSPTCFHQRLASAVTLQLLNTGNRGWCHSPMSTLYCQRPSCQEFNLFVESFCVTCLEVLLQPRYTHTRSWCGLPEDTVLHH